MFYLLLFPNLSFVSSTGIQSAIELVAVIYVANGCHLICIMTTLLLMRCSTIVHVLAFPGNTGSAFGDTVYMAQVDVTLVYNYWIDYLDS